MIYQRDLLQKNNSCTYDTNQDIQLMERGNFQQYIEQKREDAENPNQQNTNDDVITPCAYNTLDNITPCNDTGLDTTEKPINGGAIGNYIGFNSCQNEYASYKSLN